MENNKEKNILFLYPPTVYANHSMFKHFTYFGETIDVVSRYVKNINVLDCGVDQIEQKVIFDGFKNCNILIMEVEPYNINTSISLAKLYKSFNSYGKIIAYGTGATILPNYLMETKVFNYIIPNGNFAPGILSVISDEFGIEYPFDKRSKVFVYNNDNYELVGEDYQLDPSNWGNAYNKLLPLERYKFFNKGMFELTIQTGCPFNCNFCSEKILFNKNCGTKYRNISDIIDIMKRIQPEFNEIYFSATTMTANREWAKELCEELIKVENKLPWRTVTRIDCVDEELLLLMKKSGMKKVCFGVETFDNDILERINKHQNNDDIIETLKLCQESGIKPKALLMLGIPGQTAESVIRTAKILKDMNIEYRFKEYSPIREAHLLDLENKDVSGYIPLFDRSTYRSDSIDGISSEEYMELLFPSNYVR